MTTIKQSDLGPTVIPFAREIDISGGAVPLTVGLDATNMRLIVWMLVGNGPTRHNFAVLADGGEVSGGGEYLATVRLPNGEAAHAFHRSG
jgi:hypothetical protein